MKILAAGIVAFLLKLVLALFTVGSDDALTWEHDLNALRTTGFAELYRSGVQYSSPVMPLLPPQAFIHPPAVLHGLKSLGMLQDQTGLPLRFWLRSTCALADAATLGLLWRMFGNRAPLWIVALSPVTILISGFHCNTDPIMMFFLVAAVFFAERGRAGRAGVAFGLACGVKLMPLIFAPAILLCLPEIRLRLQWLAVSAVVWIAISLPYLAQEPTLILRTMLGYGSSTGLWGFSLLSTVLGGNRIYDPAAKWIALLAAAFVPLIVKRRLFAQSGLIAFCFLLLSPGFGLQYLAWTLPWTVLLRRRAVLAYHVVMGMIVLTIYAAVSQNTAAGVYAELLDRRHFPVLVLMRIVCWLAIGASMAILWADPNPALSAMPGDPGNTPAIRDY